MGRIMQAILLLFTDSNEGKYFNQINPTFYHPIFAYKEINDCFYHSRRPAREDDYYIASKIFYALIFYCPLSFQNKTAIQSFPRASYT